MGDLRFQHPYRLVKEDRPRALRELGDGELVEALAAAALDDEPDPLLVNVLTTEITNRTRRTHAILGSLGEGVYFVDPDARVRFMNPAAERMLGWPLDEIAGRDAHATFHDGGGPGGGVARSACGVNVALHEGRVVAKESAFSRRDGTRFPVFYTASPVIASDGAVLGAAVVFQDNTESLRAFETQARLAAIVEASVDGIIGKSLDGRITSWNSAAERLYGYSAEEVVGEHVGIILLPEHLEDERERLARVSEGASMVFETQRVRKDGSRLHVRVSLAPVREASGQVVGVASIQHDVTDRREAEAVLQRAATQLSDALDALTQPHQQD